MFPIPKLLFFCGLGTLYAHICVNGNHFFRRLHLGLIWCHISIFIHPFICSLIICLGLTLFQVLVQLITGRQHHRGLFTTRNRHYAPELRHQRPLTGWGVALWEGRGIYDIRKLILWGFLEEHSNPRGSYCKGPGVRQSMSCLRHRKKVRVADA
jgi:hypothetical protein